jgi:hypothetical protein
MPTVAFLSPPRDDDARVPPTVRHPDATAADDGYADLKRAVVAMGKFTLLYAIAGALLRFVLARWGSSELVGTTPARRARAVLYMLSTVNCCVTLMPFLRTSAETLRTFGSIVPAPFTSITRTGTTRLDATPEEDKDGEPHFNPETSRSLLRQARFIDEAMLGYLIHDLLMILPEAKEYPADVFHHIAGITCGVASLVNIRRVYPFLPVFFSAEFSTIFLNLIWMFREFPQTAAAVFPGRIGTMLRDKIAPLCFAGSFGVIRACMFPVMTLRLYSTPVTLPVAKGGGKAPPTTSNALEQMLGRPAAYTLLSLLVLQWYWFVLVVRKVARQMTA